jgi:hypothetical protein
MVRASLPLDASWFRDGPSLFGCLPWNLLFQQSNVVTIFEHWMSNGKAPFGE